MKTTIRSLSVILAMALLAPLASAQVDRQSQAFKLHNIFGNNMVLQRDKPIKVWGWAKPGSKVTVTLGKESAEATTAPASPVDVFGYQEAYKGLGKWEVGFPAREASTDPITLAATTGGETITLDNVLVGDVWVMSGQSNMAFSVDKTDAKDLLPQANIPMLRFFQSVETNKPACRATSAPRPSIPFLAAGMSPPRKRPKASPPSAMCLVPTSNVHCKSRSV